MASWSPPWLPVEPVRNVTTATRWDRQMPLGPGQSTSRCVPSGCPRISGQAGERLIEAIQPYRSRYDGALRGCVTRHAADEIT